MTEVQSCCSGKLLGIVPLDIDQDPFLELGS
jgi:hypothetical protein